MLTAQDGRRIARKAGSEIKTKRKKHDRVKIILEGQVIASYGIQRSSREKDHSYIAGQLGISVMQARDFAKCPLSVEVLIAILKENGRIS